MIMPDQSRAQDHNVGKATALGQAGAAANPPNHDKNGDDGDNDNEGKHSLSSLHCIVLN